MSLEFSTVNLGDIVSLVIDYRGKTPKKLGSDWSEKGIRALSAKNIKTGSIIREDTIRYVDNELYKKWMKDEIKRNDIIITSEAPFGEVFFWDSDEKIVLSQRLFGIRCNTQLVDPKFIYFYMTSDDFQWELQSRATGTTVKGLRQPELLKCRIQLPDIDDQRKISYILSNIEEKIIVLKKLNKNLFNISSSLQTDWMINFTPFKSKEFKSSSFGLIPEDWNVGKLGDVIELLDSKRIPISGQKRENMEKIYPYYGAASLMDYVDDYIFDGIYLLMGEDGTVIDEKGFPILQYVWGKFWVNNHAHILKGKNGFNVDSLYLLLSKTNIQSIVTGAVQAKVNQSNLKSIEIIIPPVEVMNEFNELIKPFFDAIRSNHDEIEKLQKLRDTLLPKLMSGEIDVSKINCDL